MRKMIALGFAVAILATAPARADEFLPNPDLTPGETNPDITQENIADTICSHHDWSTKSVRPPASYTNKLKVKQIEEYGYEDTDPHSYEEDHLIPLTLGSNPRDPHNLWPEPWDGEYGAHVKDKLEVKINKLVCSGELTLEEAQHAIAINWIAAYKQYVGVKVAR